MPVKYKAVAQAQPGIKGGGRYRYYARIAGRKRIGLDDLSRQIANSTTMSRADIIGVLTALLDNIPDHLKAGDSISLGEFGTISLSINSDPAGTAVELGNKHIKGAKIRFRPGVAFKRAMQNITFEKLEE